MRVILLHTAFFVVAGCGRRDFNANLTSPSNTSQSAAKQDASQIGLEKTKTSVLETQSGPKIISVGIKTINRVEIDTAYRPLKDAPPTSNDALFEICFVKDKTSVPDSNSCLPLELKEPGLRDFRPQGFDRYHLSGKTSEANYSKHVVFRPRGNTKASVAISCLDLRFDGISKFCKENITGNSFVGIGRNETRELRFSLDEPKSCVSCETNETFTQNGKVWNRGGVSTGGMLVAKPKLGVSEPKVVRVWVRTDATRDVRVLLSESSDGKKVIATATVRPKPEDDFSATLTLRNDNIKNNMTYFYRVFVDNVPQDDGWIPVRTFSTVNRKVRIAMGSCAKFDQQDSYNSLTREQKVYTALTRLHRDAGLDAMLFLGDNFYGDRKTLDGHRFEYRDLDRFPARADLLMRVPSIATWDDHDFVGNDSDGMCLGKEDALRGFTENWPNPSFGIENVPGTFTSTKIGPLDIFVLDCRYYRPRIVNDRQKCTLPDSATISNALASQEFAYGPLGRKQYDWLMAGLQNSRAPFKMIACGSMFTTSRYFVDSWGSFSAIQPSSYDVLSAAQSRFFRDLKDKNISGVVLASGDAHRSEFRMQTRTDTYPLYEFVSSPLSLSHTNNCDRNEPESDKNKRITDSERKIPPCYADGNSFVSVEVDGTAQDPTLTARIHKEDGSLYLEKKIKHSELQAR